MNGTAPSALVAIGLTADRVRALARTGISGDQVRLILSPGPSAPNTTDIAHDLCRRAARLQVQGSNLPDAAAKLNVSENLLRAALKVTGRRWELLQP